MIPADGSSAAPAVHHQAWHRDSHAEMFDAWRYLPRFALRTVYESYNEIRLLNEVIAQKGVRSLLEVGCATGELYRYLRSRWPSVRYVGTDISWPAIRRARAKYPKGTFLHTGGDLAAADLAPVDVVFCRDVVHHQPDPLPFLRTLYALSSRHLVLRLRTRDVGATEFDPAQSCQYMYGTWVPYIVLQCDELVAECARWSPPPEQIRFLKHYMILGGRQNRFLPKACYEEATGTAESAALITRGQEGAQTQVLRESRRDGIRSPAARLRHAAGRVIGRAIRMARRGRDDGPTWW